MAYVISVTEYITNTSIINTERKTYCIETGDARVIACYIEQGDSEKK